MKALFTGFLTVSLSASIVICLVFVLRLLLKKAPKALICVLWSLIVLRLLLPFQIESSFSLRPETPVFSRTDTQLFGSPAEIAEDGLPSFVPQQVIGAQLGEQAVTVDYLSIAGILWAAGAAAMLLYTLITYVRLKLSVADAIRVKENVYESAKLNTAFLLGYIHPRIYLPSQLEAGNAETVIHHERAHIKRGDNWLKLITFVALALHWYNPFVWVAYILLCRDIEDACDEMVIRDLDEQGRRNYSSALLSCGRKKRSLAGCPVPFGEISIRQRVLNVLNYKKPALWICIFAIVMITAVSVFFMTDPLSQKYPPHYDMLSSSIGMPIEDVLSELGISETAEKKPNYYIYPEKVEYQGVEFQLNLVYEPSDEAFSAFAYVAAYDGCTDEAAQDVATLARHLGSTFGPGNWADDRTEPELLKTLTADRVREIYSDSQTKSYWVNPLIDSWLLTDEASANIIAYAERLGATDGWASAWGKFDLSPQFYFAFESTYEPSVNTTYIYLQYRVGAASGLLTNSSQSYIKAE